MKKLFRWFALALLVGAMAFAGIGGSSASAEEAENSLVCGYAGIGGTVPLVSYCQACPGGPWVTVHQGNIRFGACLRV